MPLAMRIGVGMSLHMLWGLWGLHDTCLSRSFMLCHIAGDSIHVPQLTFGSSWPILALPLPWNLRHRQRMDKLNAHLGSLSEHFDIPKAFSGLSIVLPDAFDGVLLQVGPG